MRGFLLTALAGLVMLSSCAMPTPPKTAPPSPWGEFNLQRRHGLGDSNQPSMPTEAETLQTLNRGNTP